MCRRSTYSVLTNACYVFGTPEIFVISRVLVFFATAAGLEYRWRKRRRERQSFQRAMLPALSAIRKKKLGSLVSDSYPLEVVEEQFENSMIQTFRVEALYSEGRQRGNNKKNSAKHKRFEQHPEGVVSEKRSHRPSSEPAKALIKEYTIAFHVATWYNFTVLAS
uniref:Uncharacterized protein n=1 Tax=Ascaris lumbricoides TaxID=6252 RepID=A0A0M3I7I8_ASCLU